MLSFAISGPVAQAYGWRAAMALAAAPAALLVPALLWMPEPERGSSTFQARGGIAALARIPGLWWIAASGALLNFILYSFSTFVSAFLSRFHELSVAQAGIWSGIGFGAAGILGALAAGYLGDRFDRLRFASLATLLAAPSFFAAIRLPTGSVSTAIPLLMIGYGLLQMYYGPVYAAIQDLVAPELRGTAMAAYFLVMYLCGGALGPLLTGKLSDHFARRAASSGMLTAEAARAIGLRDAMYVIPALALALAAILWAGSRTMPARLSHSA
jgi:predicted MFS family arabinose efflux permease